MNVNTQITNQKETIMVIGCGRFGSWLAGMLSAEECRVIVVDKVKKSFEQLSDSFGGFAITGDATDVGFLQSLELEDVFLAVIVTNDDNTNSLIAQIVCEILKIQKVIVRFSDPDSMGLIKDLGIDMIVPFQLSVDAFKTMTAEYFTE